MTYRPPLRDLSLSLTAVGADALPGMDHDLKEAVLEGAGALAADVLAPLNRSGDLEGSRLENGQVRTPKGFPEAYKAFAEGGWTSLTADPAHGGQGLPKALELAIYEMVNAANMAFALCPTLSAAGIEALQQHGTPRQQALYLPRMVSGEWTGTMQLTEPQAGSDLGAVRAIAEPDGQGQWRLTGQKIFITWGDHDCTDNIIGMVLARTKGAPEGIKGLSLFLVPKRLVNEDGSLAEANTAKAVSVEHKLGIHASPTCVMAHEAAYAELVGVEGQGLTHMFVMMNAARQMVGIQGVGIADMAFQRALEYAKDRRQGRAAWSEERPAAIIDHPDVRRMLTLSKAKIEAARAICLLTGVSADLARLGETEEIRRAAKLREELLTPIAKAWSTDVGVEVSDLALQVHGGMGYIEETGAAQHYRDARIPPIYEGTNGIQANDLVGRKLAMEGAKAMRDLLAEMARDAAALDGDLAPLGVWLTTAVAALERATDGMVERAGTDDALAGAVAYGKLAGNVIGGWLLARMAVVARARAGQGRDDGWLESKAALARFYGDQVLTASDGLADVALSGASGLRGVTTELLGR